MNPSNEKNKCTNLIDGSEEESTPLFKNSEDRVRKKPVISTNASITPESINNDNSGMEELPAKCKNLFVHYESNKDDDHTRVRFFFINLVI